MPLREKFSKLKKLSLKNAEITLVAIREYKQNKIAKYIMKYIQIDEKLENRLRNIVLNKIENANTFEAYSVDSSEIEDDEIKGYPYEATDFYNIFAQLKELNPETDIITSIQDLLKTKSYMIIVRTISSIKLIGVKSIPENWKLKFSKGLIPLLFIENRFEDLEDEKIFNISNFLDFIYYDEVLFILSKKGFETALNFREGMIKKTDIFYNEASKLKLFLNIDILKEKVHKSPRYLRKVASVVNLGYYKDMTYLARLKEISLKKKWDLHFDGQSIILTESNIDSVLSVLQNKRLHSELTDETFDVDSAKKLINIVANND